MISARTSMFTVSVWRIGPRIELSRPRTAIPPSVTCHRRGAGARRRPPGLSDVARRDREARRLARSLISAVFVNADPLYTVNSSKIVALADRHRMLTLTSWEGFAADGGLISYGTSINEANRQLGVYTGRVLKGTRPGDLAVVQSTTLQLVINLT